MNITDLAQEPLFSIGRTGSPRPRRRRRAPAAADGKSLIFDTECFTKRRTWLLLPADHVPSHAVSLFLNPCHTLTSAHTAVADYATPTFKPTPFSRRFMASLTPRQRCTIRMNNPFDHPLEKVLECWQVFEKNLGLRTQFKRIAAAWLRRRKLRAANEEDLATCETPRTPVTLTDWPNRRIYTFEARTILKDITERLLLRDELWTNPQAPRNPFTNAALTVGQLLHVHTQLRAAGLTHWTLEGLATVGYSVTKFALQYDEPLRHAALKGVFRNPHTVEFQDVLMEFIQQEHDHHGQDCPRLVYLWALIHAVNSSHMLAWRKACRLFHEYTITVSDQKELTYKQDNVIDPMTEPLCEYPRTLAAERALWLRSRTAPVAHPVVPSPP